jgi:hypothetical protein
MNFVERGKTLVTVFFSRQALWSAACDVSLSPIRSRIVNQVLHPPDATFDVALLKSMAPGLLTMKFVAA